MVFEGSTGSSDDGRSEVDGKKKKISQYTREAMRETNYDDKAAATLLVFWSQADHDLHAMLIKLGADQAVRSYFTHERKAPPEEPRIIVPSSPELRAAVRSPLSTAERVERQDEKVRRRLFWDRYALFGHMQLRAARRPDLRTSISKRAKQIEGNQRCLNFESDIVSHLKNDKLRVDQHFKITEVIEIAKAHNVL